MKKNKKVILLVSVVYIVFAVILVYGVVKTTLNETTVTESVADGEKEIGASSVEDAEALIGKTLTREEIEAALGKCVKFDMSNEGCERGVYAGRFYFDKFTIFSRTYDKGQTFNVVSVNE